MARLHSPFSFSGPLGGFSAYNRKDLEGTFLRNATSLDKERIYSDPAFENTLREATEGGGRSKAAKLLRRVLHPLDPIRVGCWNGPFTGAMMPLQELDTESAYGQRSVLFSRHGHLLEGLGLSRRTPFETLLRNPITYTLSKETLQAQVSFPAVTPGVNFFAPASQPYFRLVAVLGAVPDLLFTPGGYKPDGDYSQLFPGEAYSDWYGVKSGAPALTLDLTLPQAPPSHSFGLLLAAGILLGTVHKRGAIEAVGYSGGGRIMAVR